MNATTSTITPTTMRLDTGQYLDLANPDRSVITIDLVATVLSRLPRFTAHIGEGYTVGQHSLAVAWLLEARGAAPDIVRDGLLHDAEEAFIGDLSRPLIELMGQMIYENAWERVARHVRAYVAAALGASMDLCSEVRDADDSILRAEVAHFWEDGEAHPVAMRMVSRAANLPRDQVRETYCRMAETLA